MTINAKIIVFLLSLVSAPSIMFGMQTQADAKRAAAAQAQNVRPAEGRGPLEASLQTVGWLGDKTIAAVVRHCANWIWDTDYTVGTRTKRLFSMPCFAVATWQAFRAGRRIKHSWGRTTMNELGEIAKPIGCALLAGMLGFALVNEPIKISQV